MLLVVITELLQKKKKLLNFVIFFQFALLAGMRANTVGTDTYKYWIMFGRLQNASWPDMIAFPTFGKFPGWWIGNKIMSIILPMKTPDLYMVLSGAIVSGLAVWIIYKYMESCKHMYRLFYLLFFLQAMNVTRQFTTVFLIFVVYKLVEEGKYKSAIVIELIAVSIHSLSIIGMVFFVFPFLKTSRRTLFISAGISAVVAFLVPTLFSLFYRYFDFYEIYSLGSETSSGKYALVYVLELLAVLCLERISKISDDTDEKRLRWIEIICVVTAIIGIGFANDVLFSRVLLYTHFFIIYATWFVLKHKNRYSQIYMLAVYSVSGASFIYRIVMNLADILPYKTFM